MLAVTFVVVLFATFYSPIVCETRGLYQLLPVTPPQIEGLMESFNSLTEVAAPRLGVALWNPFDYFSWDALLQPAITTVGLIFGVFGFVQITEWLVSLVAATKKKGEDKKKPEVKESNEIEEARRKRTISAEESKRVIESIEKAQEQFGL